MPTQTKDDSGERLLPAGKFKRALNICTSTLRNWRLKGYVRFQALPSGHYRYPESEVARINKIQAPASYDSGEDKGSDKQDTRGDTK
jgi:hypothetical protein